MGIKNHENEILDDIYKKKETSRICQPWPHKEESGPGYQYSIEVANASKLIVLFLNKKKVLFSSFPSVFKERLLLSN